MEIDISKLGKDDLNKYLRQLVNKNTKFTIMYLKLREIFSHRLILSKSKEKKT